mmetsp:Transcript_10212/g.18043  ORF Transcript_10212/g.18043 Transcript_10212/m.18043 type:complete len:287 (+) Transcript_10212:2581-3441(+)
MTKDGTDMSRKLTELPSPRACPNRATFGARAPTPKFTRKRQLRYSIRGAATFGWAPMKASSAVSCSCAGDRLTRCDDPTRTTPVISCRANVRYSAGERGSTRNGAWPSRYSPMTGAADFCKRRKGGMPVSPFSCSAYRLTIAVGRTTPTSPAFMVDDELASKLQQGSPESTPKDKTNLCSRCQSYTNIDSPAFGDALAGHRGLGHDEEAALSACLSPFVAFCDLKRPSTNCAVLSHATVRKDVAMTLVASGSQLMDRWTGISIDSEVLGSDSGQHPSAGTGTEGIQ